MKKQIILIIICILFFPFTVNAWFDKDFDKVEKQKLDYVQVSQNKSNIPTLYFKFTKPVNGVLSINNNTYYLEKSPDVFLPAGSHPFSIKLSNNQNIIYGMFTIPEIDKEALDTTFGAKNKLFKESHIEAALTGRPVNFKLGFEKANRTRIIAAQYKLSLRPIQNY